jgi:hypothetical protein
MTTAATSLLGLALPVTGELSGTWGDTVNNSITSLVDSAIAGTTTISSDADVTLTTTTLAANQAREAIILWTASGTVTRNITAPAQSKAYIVINATGSTQSIVLRGAGPTTGVTIVAGEKALCAWNGSDFVKIATTATASSFSAGTTGFTPSTATTGAITLAGTLGTANGGTNLTSFTSGGAVYATSTSALTTGTLPIASGGTAQTSFTAGYIHFGSFSTSANLFWDNTNFRLGIGTSSPSYALDVASSTIRIGSTASDGAITWGTSDVARIALTSSTEYRVGWGRNASVNLTFLTNDTERIRISTVGLVGVGTASATSMLQTAGSTSVSAFKTPNIAEVNTISATAATGTINYDVTTQSVLYYTTNASGNFTVNFRGSSGTSLNTVMQTGESISATFLVTNGSTAYYNSAVTIDGNSVTPKWQGGSAPTSGDASAIDSYTYVIIKVGSASFTVLASVTKFA